MRLDIESNFDSLIQRLERSRKEIPQKGRKIMERAADQMLSAARHNLETQGRSGIGPPLSPFTLEVYRRTQFPDGSGIRNHMSVTRTGKGAVVGIAKGEPSEIAKIQNHGAAIAVTESQRQFFRSIGMSLKAKIVYVPGRRFWDAAERIVVMDAQKEIREMLQGYF